MLPIACGGSTDTPEPVPDPVEVAELGLRFARLPTGFEVADNGARLVLAPTAGASEKGTMTVGAGEVSDFGLDPVVDANGQQARFESLEGGQFLGVQKLVVPAGPAAYARGRFTEGGETKEQTTVFVVHPSVNRMLQLSYVYPASDDPEDSRTRVQLLFDLVAEMEAADTTAPAEG